MCSVKVIYNCHNFKHNVISQSFTRIVLQHIISHINTYTTLKLFWCCTIIATITTQASLSKEFKNITVTPPPPPPPQLEFTIKSPPYKHYTQKKCLRKCCFKLKRLSTRKLLNSFREKSGQKQLKEKKNVFVFLVM